MMEKNNFSGRKAILIGIDSDDHVCVDESLEELENLCKTLDIEVLDWVVQKRKKPDSRYYLGKGKIEKLRNLKELMKADLIVADGELNPIQARNIEDITGAEVLDRTQIILEIFAHHATSEEGKIQVEMAQLEYKLPRIVGKGEELSRLGGGIGTRGPGEQLLEQERRRIKDRISVLRKKLEEIKVERDVQRRRRLKSGIPHISIAGYTNAGKSTLLKVLTDTDVLIADKLFATLEPTTRRLKLPNGRVILISDTVGFIRKLPHSIVAAFHATLEEITFSDLILVLVDVSDVHMENKLKACYDVLREIKADSIKKILVFNKVDMCTRDRIEKLSLEYPDAVFISALKREGLNTLVKRLERELFSGEEKRKFIIPISKVGIVYSYRENLEIIDEKYNSDIVEMILKGKKEVLDTVESKVKGP